MQSGSDLRNCRACGAPLSAKPLMTLENMPAGAQNLPSPADRDTERGITVHLCACSSCGLVQLDNDPVPYYRDVIRSGGYSTTMDALRRSQYDHWIGTYDLRGKKILEAGCGQGEFLQILAEYPVQAFGMEHDPTLVRKAREKGLTVSEDYPDTEDQVFENGPFDGFTSFNFLEHQPDPVRYLKAIARNLTEGACGLVTVPSFEYILEQSSFYELIPDHLLYFTEDTLTSLMTRCGFAVLEMERINRDTISVIVRKGETPAAGSASDRIPAPDVSGLLLRKETIAEEAQTLLLEWSNGQSLAVWGASHQGFTLCAVAGLSDGIRYIIDSAPFKQGKIAPASHIPIVSPEEAMQDPPAAILIVAPGYTAEIEKGIRERFPAGTAIYTLMTDHITFLGTA